MPIETLSHLLLSCTIINFLFLASEPAHGPPAPPPEPVIVRPATRTGEAPDARVLQIELHVVRGLSGRQIEMLKREANAIWEPQDVKIDWAGDGIAASVRVMIDRPAYGLQTRQQDEQWRVAESRVVDGRVSPPIYVSLDAAERVVRAANPPYSSPALAGIMLPRVVGRAIAHELAHVLLNTRAHATHGLLRARFTADDFVSPVRDAFTLDSAQIALARQHEVLLVPH